MESTKAKAFALLARKSYFSKQLRRKLAEKGYPEDEIEAVIAELIRKGWLNDQELASRYIEQQKQKGYGAKKIALQLREKAGQIEVDLDESEEALRALIQKRYLSKLAVGREKVIKALLRRGFSYGLICRVLQTEE